MSLGRVLVPVRRPQNRWRLVLPLYQGMECPDCGAVCCGDQARSAHERWHVEHINWAESLLSSITDLFRRKGLRVAFEPHDGTEEDGETAGDRLAAKAARAARNPEYDEDEEEAG